jgi:hypothetical protein
MFRVNAKGLATALGCSAAIAMAGATALPRTATVAGSGGYAGCDGTNYAACGGLASDCTGSIFICNLGPGYTCTPLLATCGTNTNDSFCLALQASCCDCMTAGPEAGR